VLASEDDDKGLGPVTSAGTYNGKDVGYSVVGPLVSLSVTVLKACILVAVGHAIVFDFVPAAHECLRVKVDGDTKGEICGGGGEFPQCDGWTAGFRHGVVSCAVALPAAGTYTVTLETTFGVWCTAAMACHAITF